MVEPTRERFQNFCLCSFDKGFYSPQNRETLTEVLDKVVMPKKGKQSKADREIEIEEEFVQIKKQHSAIESAINALEVHGQDVCPDHGIEGFKRYVVLAVVGRNIQKLGTILLQQKREKTKSAKKN